jgi:Putative transposase
MLIAAHEAGQLQFFDAYAALADTNAFVAFLVLLRRSVWVVYSKKPFGGPEAVLAYLARYTHRVAISNRRLIAADAIGVTLLSRQCPGCGGRMIIVETFQCGAPRAPPSPEAGIRTATP